MHRGRHPQITDSTTEQLKTYRLGLERHYNRFKFKALLLKKQNRDWALYVHCMKFVLLNKTAVDRELARRGINNVEEEDRKAPSGPDYR